MAYPLQRLARCQGHRQRDRQHRQRRSAADGREVRWMDLPETTSSTYATCVLAAFGGPALPGQRRALTWPRASQPDAEHPMLGSMMRVPNQVADLIISQPR